ncbi:cysteine dioxygenase [Nocardia sp. NBC_01499]|uniref:cysteine dioxygenase n=1 Tax=Nocardia sp. NBC_01499 TaxID=2903597 RepID=UPI00386B4AB8
MSNEYLDDEKCGDLRTTLGQLVMMLADTPDLWRPFIRFDPQQRYFYRIATTPDREAWLTTWCPGQFTGLHDHGGSSGAFVVLRGVLHETVVTPRPDGEKVRLRNRVYSASRYRTFGPRHLHDVANRGPAPAVSLHLYAPALTTMTRYRIDSGHLSQLAIEHAGLDW